MKFIHTADWHLGKTLKNQSLIEDQRYILKKFLQIVDDNKVDAIVIAGDIYDRNIPPEEAVDLFNWILNKLIIERNLPVLCISGNHDSKSRLNFGSRIFDNSNLHIRTKLIADMTPVVLNDDYGEVYFSLIPYFEPIDVKKLFNLDDETELSYDEAGKILVDAARSKIPSNSRSVAVTHAFITGGVESGSEKKLPGGLGQVNPAHFKDYNYTALGHLHGSTLTNKNIRYSGSLLKYSFDEEKQSKSVTIVEIDSSGNVKVDYNLPLTPIRDVRVIRGSIEDILKVEPKSDDYISVQYEGLNVPNLNAKLRNKFINLLEFKPADKNSAQFEDTIKRQENISNVELFKNFFKATTGDNLNEEELFAVTTLIEDMEKSNY